MTNAIALSSASGVGSRGKVVTKLELHPCARARAAALRTLGSESGEINVVLERRFEVTENGCCRAGFWIELAVSGLVGEPVGRRC